MKTIKNPEKGAPIKDFLHLKKLYSLGIGEAKAFDDEVADRLLEVYAFLEEVKLNGKYVCKYGDYANDQHIAVIAHEKGHKSEPVVEEGKEFITPQERATAERAARFDPEGIPAASGVDKDGVEWYGEGLTTDDEFIRPNVRRPGAF